MRPILNRLARFQREAQVLASLNHPGIATIYGLEESGDTRALVLELVEGPILADRIRKGPIPVDEALPIAKQIAEALEAAHEAGVIHRDLKPANIKVREDGTVKVLNFGLAKAFQPDASDPSTSMSPTISLTAAATQMGMVIGTAAYMAPEQAKGKTVDKRADVWALGAVLYEMLTGQKPFTGRDVSDTLAAVLRIDADFDALPDATPPRVQQVLKACLQKEPKDRVRDIGDVSLAMDGTFETTSSPQPVAAPQLQVWQRPIPATIAGLAVLIVGGLAVWALTPVPPRPVVRFVANNATTSLASGPNTPDLAISPDGTRIAYRSVGDSNSLYVRPLDQLDGTPLLVEFVVASLFFSPDGTWIGFITPTDGTYKKASIEGGPPVTLWPNPAGAPRGASWGPDDTIVFAGTQSRGLLRGPAAGGEPEVLTTPDEMQGELNHWWPEVLPGGQAGSL